MVTNSIIYPKTYTILYEEKKSKADDDNRSGQLHL